MFELMIGPTSHVICNYYSETIIHRVGIFCVSIAIEGDPIPIIVEGKWIDAFVHMHEAEF